MSPLAIMSRSSRIESATPQISGIAVVAFACFGFVVTAWAQKDTGSIVGVVKDTSGAVIAGAKVRVTEVDQGTSFRHFDKCLGRILRHPAAHWPL